jgi:hypothetical protein
LKKEVSFASASALLSRLSSACHDLSTTVTSDAESSEVDKRTALAIACENPTRLLKIEEEAAAGDVILDDC